MSRPKLLLMDEPCQGLSPIMVKEIGKTIRSLNESGITILLVEHNVSIALGVADHVYILRNGGIVFEGSPDAFSPPTSSPSGSISRDRSDDGTAGYRPCQCMTFIQTEEP